MHKSTVNTEQIALEENKNYLEIPGMVQQNLISYDKECCKNFLGNKLVKFKLS